MADGEKDNNQDTHGNLFLNGDDGQDGRDEPERAGS
jgi:hypothetical protein